MSDRKEKKPPSKPNQKNTGVESADSVSGTSRGSSAASTSTATVTTTSVTKTTTTTTTSSSSSSSLSSFSFHSSTSSSRFFTSTFSTRPSTSSTHSSTSSTHSSTSSTRPSTSSTRSSTSSTRSSTSSTRSSGKKPWTPADDRVPCIADFSNFQEYYDWMVHFLSGKDVYTASDGQSLGSSYGGQSSRSETSSTTGNTSSADCRSPTDELEDIFREAMGCPPAQRSSSPLPTLMPAGHNIYGGLGFQGRPALAQRMMRPRPVPTVYGSSGNLTTPPDQTHDSEDFIPTVDMRTMRLGLNPEGKAVFYNYSSDPNETVHFLSTAYSPFSTWPLRIPPKATKEKEASSHPAKPKKKKSDGATCRESARRSDTGPDEPDGGSGGGSGRGSGRGSDHGPDRASSSGSSRAGDRSSDRRTETRSNDGRDQKRQHRYEGRPVEKFEKNNDQKREYKNEEKAEQKSHKQKLEKVREQSHGQKHEQNHEQKLKEIPDHRPEQIAEVTSTAAGEVLPLPQVTVPKPSARSSGQTPNQQDSGRRIIDEARAGPSKILKREDTPSVKVAGEKPESHIENDKETRYRNESRNQRRNEVSPLRGRSKKRSPPSRSRNDRSDSRISYTERRNESRIKSRQEDSKDRHSYRSDRQDTSRSRRSPSDEKRRDDKGRQKLIEKWRLNNCSSQDEMNKRLEALVQMRPDEIVAEENKVWIRSAPATCYYERDPNNVNRINGTPRLKALCDEFKYELLERGMRARQAQTLPIPPPLKPKQRVCQHKSHAGESSEHDSDLSEGCEDVSELVHELERKQQHPYRLHPELWFNDPGEMNDGPLCRCSAKARRSGIRHGFYAGEQKDYDCVQLSNNGGKLYHYRITISPPTNFLTRCPTIINYDDHEFIFEGFSLISHYKIEKLPVCKVIRFNIEYTILYIEEKFPDNFCVLEVDLFHNYLFKEILELVDFNLHVPGYPDGCPQFHFMPRFVRELPDNGRELLPMCEVLKFMLRSNVKLFEEDSLEDFHKMSKTDWQNFADSVKGMVVTHPGMKPSSIRVDQLDRDTDEWLRYKKTLRGSNKTRRSSKDRASRERHTSRSGNRSRGSSKYKTRKDKPDDSQTSHSGSKSGVGAFKSWWSKITSTDKSDTSSCDRNNSVGSSTPLKTGSSHAGSSTSVHDQAGSSGESTSTRDTDRDAYRCSDKKKFGDKKSDDDKFKSDDDKSKPADDKKPKPDPSGENKNKIDVDKNDKKFYPEIVHFGIRPPQLSYAGNPEYQKAWRKYVKFRHLLANMPKPTAEDKQKLAAKETRLHAMRANNKMKRDVTVTVSGKGFYLTGLMCDVVQHAMLIPVLVCHLRFHRSLHVLENTINYRFEDKFLLQLALTHPSYRENFGTNSDHARNSLTNCGIRQPKYGDKRIHYMNTRKRGINTLINIMSRFGKKNETKSSIYHNERLEFLGDAVVEFITSTHLFHIFRDLEEGGLATYRAALVQNQHLAVLAKKLNLDAFMLYAHGSDLCHDLELKHAMANCFEALMGALFLDGGIDAPDKVLANVLYDDDEDCLDVWSNFPPHILQEQEPLGDRKWISHFPFLQKLTEFEQATGIEFNHIRLLARAFTDRSVGYTNLTLGSNQRLEFLGDSVLQLISSEYLYKYFPEHHEGHLSLLRSSLVNNKTQSVVCDDLGMTHYALYANPKVELKVKDRADLLEAFLGALYVDSGMDICRVFCDVCFFPRLQLFIMNQDWNDPKSKLQQCCLTLRSMDNTEPDIPMYKVIECKGPTNTRVYTVAVYFRNKRLAKATGHSIQQAEMNAAQKAMEEASSLFPQLDHQKRVIAKSLKNQKWPTRSSWVSNQTDGDVRRVSREQTVDLDSSE